MGSGQSPSPAGLRRSPRLWIFHIHRKQRVESGEQFGVEEHSAVLLWSLRNGRFRRFHRTDIFHYGSTIRWLLPVRFDHSKRTAVIVHASHVLDPNRRRWQNNPRYRFVCFFLFFCPSIFFSLSFLRIDYRPINDNSSGKSAILLSACKNC